MAMSNSAKRLCAAALLLVVGSAADATTLFVNCGGKGPLTSIGAALKVLQGGLAAGPTTINVSGACHENVVIQSIDRLTLNAVGGASITDASGGALDVIDIFDSRDVAINRFTINAGSNGSGTNGVGCGDSSLCRLSGNVIQGAASGAGFSIFQQSQGTIDGDTLQNNDIGLLVLSGSKLRQGADRTFVARANHRGIDLRRGAFAYVGAVVENNSDVGVIVRFQSTLEITGGSISGNGNVGAVVREGSFARFTATTISGNAGGGVTYSDLSMGDFVGSIVTGNGGQTDVLCNPQYSATRGALTDTGGGTTNCVEP